jgi:succinate-semialdehyde dehydrogenase / glutarate-semialdehyde dehydrogenase
LTLDPNLLARLLSRITIAGGAREQLPVIAPFNGHSLACIPACTESDVDAAVTTARYSQAKWAALPVSQRTRIFLRFHDLLLRRQNEVLDLIQLENGKARRHAFEEVLDTAIAARYYARHSARLLRPRRRKGALPLLTKTYELRVPVGVVGLIVPWNYPLNLAITDAIPALIAGNTAVLKPDPQTSLTALWAADLLLEAGLPPGVLNVITGDGALLGPALVDRADYIMFTGSTRVGRMVARQCADRLVGCSLELGGKNPMIVLADADLDAAVDGAIRGCFVGAGQVCISMERIYVERTIYEPFLALFIARAKALQLGPAMDYSAEMGSLTSPRQLERIEDHVRDAVEKGAVLHSGGRRRPDLGPLFYEPTIFTGVREDMKLYAEETFGPVVAVYPFAIEAEAIQLANDTPYGLNASLWTRNTRRGIDLASRIEAGSVNVNEVYAAAWGSMDSPSGGMKQSGLRPRHGSEGILKFTEPQTIAVQRLLPIAPSHGVSAQTYARWMTRLVGLLRYIRVIG